MKKIVFATMLAFSTFSVSEAMRNDVIAEFQCQTNPPVCVYKIADNKLSYSCGGLNITTPSIRVSAGSSLSGLTLQNQLIISGDMSEEAIKSALESAFNCAVVVKQ
ncbi:MAG: hypothetical protein LBO02_03780 [Holosporaceae bacterium]|jgi:hypothetical protein|nr:hypothetical protein [Holosporaceae bacterium]